jgi:hypothetical protein
LPAIVEPTPGNVNAACARHAGPLIVDLSIIIIDINEILV